MKIFSRRFIATPFICFAFLFLVISFNGYPQTSVKAGTTKKCFIVSDIHFDPLFGAHKDTALYKKLESLPVSEWQKLFGGSVLQTTVNSDLLGKDANYGVLTASLANMHKRLPNPAFIVIAGDFIWHGAKPADSVLKRKSIQFIANLFKARFPGVTILPASGNNDTYGADYELQDARFLKDFAAAWSPNLPKTAAGQLTKWGYYAFEKDNLKLMVINTAALSYGSQYPDQADSLLNWVRANLAGAKTKNVWIVMHIPPGLNGYNLKNMWNVDNAQTFMNSIVQYAPKVKLCIASHTHFNDFKVFYNAANTPVALMRIVPSVCDNHGNNPSFEIAEFNSTSGQVAHETNYYLNLAAIPKDKSAGPEVVWTDAISLPAAIGSDKIGADSFSKFIDNIKSDKSGQALKSYIKFYTVGTPTDSTKTINKSNYLNYLKADSLKGK